MDERTALLEENARLREALADLDVQRAKLDAELREREASDAKKDERIVRLEQNVAALTLIIWGGSEKRDVPPERVEQNQLYLSGILEGDERAAETKGADATGDVLVKPHRRKKKGRRSTFPDHFPVVRTTFELRDEERTCSCGGHLESMGEETTKELERVELCVVHELVRKKYCCRACQEKVVTAPGPDRVIDKGPPGVGFLAHVLTERFLNHMPYHRQEKKYASEGLSISRSVLSTSAKRCSEPFQPVADQLRREILAEDIVQTDDSPVTIQRASTGTTKQCRV